MWQTIVRIPIPGFLQSLFHLGPFLPVYGYGLMLVIGFFTAMQLAQFLARRNGIDPDVFANAALIALLAGVAGARISHVLENLSDFTNPDRSAWQNFLAMINIRSGGLTYYGGFLLAFPAVLVYGIFKSVPIRLGMDIVAPCLMLGLGFGRIGCYLNGCCYGAETTVPWAAVFPYMSNAYMDQAQRQEIQIPPVLLKNGYPRSKEDVQTDPTLTDRERAELLRLIATQQARPVHPAELYSTITAFLIAAFLITCFTLPHAPGRVFAAMLVIEGISRFLLEILPHRASRPRQHEPEHDPEHPPGAWRNRHVVCLRRCKARSIGSSRRPAIA